MTATSVFDQLPLEQIEETSGELHRRAGAALRRIGEQGADEADIEGVSPRERVATLTVAIELAGATFAAAASATELPRTRTDLQPITVNAAMYGTPTLAAQLTRLEQDRRILASLARHLEDRLDEVRATAWGERRLRDVLIEHAITEPARCAQSLEQIIAVIEAETITVPEP
jgi:hypothetical protein